MGQMCRLARLAHGQNEYRTTYNIKCHHGAQDPASGPCDGGIVGERTADQFAPTTLATTTDRDQRNAVMIASRKAVRARS